MFRRIRIIFSLRLIAVSCSLILQLILKACVLLINATLQKYPGLLIGEQMMLPMDHVIKQRCAEQYLLKRISV